LWFLLGFVCWRAYLFDVSQIIHRTRNSQQTQFDQWYAALHSRTGTNLVTMAAHSSAYVGADNNLSSNLSAQSKAATLSDENRVGRRSEWKDDKADIYSHANEDIDDVNEHISAFYQAKDDLLKRRQGH
jgi:hypothetical protein